MLEFTSVLVSDFRATTATIPTVIIIRTDITDRTTGITDIGIIVIIIPIIAASLIRITKWGWL
jgi:hypothetical protein